MNAVRAAGFGMAGLGLLALAALVVSPPAAAAEVNISGNWTISSFLSYDDDVINVTNTSETDGFVTIDPAGILLLQNTTLLLPYNRTLDVRGSLLAFNSTLDGAGWFFWIRGQTWLDNVNVTNATHDTGAGFSGTYLVNASSQLHNVNWTRSNGESGTIHMRIPFNFSGNYVGRGITLSYEMPGLTTPRTIDISWNRFDLGGSGVDAVSFAPQTHTAAITFDIHDNNFTGGDDAVRIRESSASTRFLVHDNTFAGLDSSAVNTNDADFHGSYAFWNLSVAGCGWAFYLRGAQGDGITTTLENVSISTCGIGVVAHHTDVWIRNSSIEQTTPAYNGYFGGHIYIYDTTDQALSTLIDGTGGSVEHFVVLNLAGATWQGGVPFQGQSLILRTPNNVAAFTINPLNWTPRYIVWWGSYDGLPDVDNRDLRPVVIDGTHEYGCTPSQFFVTRPMAPVSVVCTDDISPRVTLSVPPGTRYQNVSTIQLTGSVIDNGSGLSLIEWSFDNASWGPVTPGGPPGNFSVSSPNKPDGPYMLYFRARDRVGLTTYLERGPFIVDTVQPPVDFDSFPVRASGTQFDVTGSSEPLVPVYLLTAGGLRFNGSTDGAGRFTLRIPLVEGLNLFYVTATDYAGNTFTRSDSILVDNVPPSIVVFNPQSAMTEATSITITGQTEPTATVEVNGLPATRAGDSFSRVITLVRGLNAITVNVTDDAGNTAQWFGSAVSDDDLPVLVAAIDSEDVTAGGLPLTKQSRASVTGQATDATTAVVTLLVGGAPAVLEGSGAFTLTVDLVEGENTFTVTAIDAVGNTQAVALRIVRDSAAPQITSGGFEAGDGALVDLDGRTYTDGDTVTLVIALSEAADIVVNGQTTSGVQGSNNLTVSVVEGSNSFVVIARDRAGNTALQRTFEVERDTTGPALSFSSPGNGVVLSESSVTVTGLTEPGTDLTVNGAAVAVGPTGGFTVRVDLVVGANTIRAVSVDALGNSKNASITVARSEPTVGPGGTEGGLPAIPLLIVGLAAGAAAGFFLGKRRPGATRSAAPSRPVEVSDSAAETTAAPAPPRPSAPPQKGPRGPRPPSP